MLQLEDWASVAVTCCLRSIQFVNFVAGKMSRVNPEHYCYDYPVADVFPMRLKVEAPVILQLPSPHR